jgi:hypothetical protein
MRFLFYIGFHNLVYSTVLQTHEQKKCTLHCAPCVSYKSRLTGLGHLVVATYGTRADKTAALRVIELPLNLQSCIGNF